MTGEEESNTLRADWEAIEDFDADGNLKASEIPDEAFSEYNKAPVTIEAVQVPDKFVVETMENKRGEKLYGEPGDYLIRGVEGELYPCAASVFTQTYVSNCKCDMHPFHFERVEDESGTSGTGIVAEGVEFADGSVMVHWFNDDNPDVDTTSDGFSFKPGPDGIKDTLEVHGHGGKTNIVFHETERSYQPSES